MRVDYEWSGSAIVRLSVTFSITMIAFRCNVDARWIRRIDRAVVGEDGRRMLGDLRQRTLTVHLRAQQLDLLRRVLPVSSNRLCIGNEREFNAGRESRDSHRDCETKYDEQIVSFQRHTNRPYNITNHETWNWLP